MRIGILALQGDFEAHAKVIQRLGAECVLVKRPADLEGVRGLILPGGESTTQLKLLQETGLRDAVLAFAQAGGALFGTCAGAILLAREVHNPVQESLGLADIVVKRNAYGRQLASEVVRVPCRLSEQPMEMVFIRAPIIEQVGSDWEVLAEWKGKPVCVRKGKVLVATFHPEMTSDTRVHEYFLQIASNGA
jgi:5'-phosphate synthase pdxT subunit